MDTGPVGTTSPALRKDRARTSGRPFRRLRLAWAMVSEPRYLSVVYGGIYTVAALTGAVTLINPPQTIAGELGPMFSVMWALLFLLGGMLGMGTVLQGLWKWERWGNYLVLGGIVIYGGVISTLHFTASGSRLTQLGVLFLAAMVFVVRITVIRGRTYGPHV